MIGGGWKRLDQFLRRYGGPIILVLAALLIGLQAARTYRPDLF